MIVSKLLPATRGAVAEEQTVEGLIKLNCRHKPKVIVYGTGAKKRVDAEN
jgi:hypothetical protein